MGFDVSLRKKKGGPEAARPGAVWDHQKLQLATIRRVGRTGEFG